MKLTVYHGSYSQFDSFSIDRVGSRNDYGYYGYGVYFTPNRGLASYYGPIIYTCTVTLSNPYVTEAGSSSDFIQELGISKDSIPDTSGSASKVITELLKDRGYDAVIVEGRPYANGLKSDGSVNMMKSPIREIVVFDPKNIEIDDVNDIRTQPATMESFIGTIGRGESIELIRAILEAYEVISNESLVDDNTIDIPTIDSRVFTIPTKLAMGMRGFNRIGDDADLTSSKWKILLDDIKQNGFKNACRIETDGTDCWLGTGNHRVLCAKILGIDELPVYLSQSKKFECPEPYMTVPLERIHRESGTAFIESVDAGQPTLYHVTYWSRLNSIADSGLQPNCNRSIGASAYDSHCTGRLFVCGIDDLSYWAEKSEDFATYYSENPLTDGLVPVVLKIDKPGLELEVDDMAKSDRRTESWFTTSGIAPEYLSVWNGSAWVEVEEYNVNPEISFDVTEADYDDTQDQYVDFKSQNPLTTIR